MQWHFDAKLLKTVWSLAWPTVTYSVLQSVVGLVDVLMVGKLGKEAIAAVGFSQQFMMLMMIGALAVTTGTTTLVAQFVGARQREQAIANANASNGAAEACKQLLDNLASIEKAEEDDAAEANSPAKG